jgi:hypothetical protein
MAGGCVVDAFSREALAIEVDQGIKGERVDEVMMRLAFGPRRSQGDQSR